MTFFHYFPAPRAARSRWYMRALAIRRKYIYAHVWSQFTYDPRRIMCIPTPLYNGLDICHYVSSTRHIIIICECGTAVAALGGGKRPLHVIQQPRTSPAAQKYYTLEPTFVCVYLFFRFVFILLFFPWDFFQWKAIHTNETLCSAACFKLGVL